MNIEQLRTLILQDPKRVFIGNDKDYRDEFGMERLPLDFKEIEIRSYKWKLYWKFYPEKQEKMIEWQKKQHKPETQPVSLSGGLALPPYSPLQTRR